MKRLRGFASLAAFVCLSSALPSASAAESPVASPSPPPEATISASELQRLSEISTRLASLNERLRTELEASKLSSAELESLLAESTRELVELRRELEESRKTSTELVLRARNSERELTELSEALRKADDSLRSLEVSFADYRQAAESRIRLLSFGWIGIGIVAAIGWILALATLLFN